MFHCFTMQKLKLFCVSFITLAILDSLALIFLTGKLIKNLFSDLSFDSLSNEKLLALLGVWALISAGIVVFVLPRVHGSYHCALWKGALYGLIIYGVYELANFIIIENWVKEFILYDIAWGTFLCAIVTCITLFIADFLKWDTVPCDNLCNTHGKERKSCL